MSIHYRPAGTQDIEDIAALMLANTAAQGGQLTGEFPPALIAEWLAANRQHNMPIMLAFDEEDLAGVLFTSVLGWTESPVVQAMLAQHLPNANEYLYGPVCIADNQRGKGILPGLFAQVQAALPGKKALLFIKTDNIASIKAHAKMGIRELTRFHCNGWDYLVLQEV
ncbi:MULTISPECIES: GNAT family N-acetyltransferase [Aeromonas]|uniref:GNAT family N-acetyltransferase n=1 Tax=Aeromonas TaxID=642 RepID=UPI00051B21F4|nr:MULTISPECIES: hypothetical protein [Aeromonas]PTT47203.1 N-acetyltransferase [Aeromonas sp. HMWF016]